MSDPIFTFTSINPFGLIDVGSSASPTLVDIDSDGDLDAYVGNYFGDTLFFRNTGTPNNPTFTYSNTTGLPGFSYNATPSFIDIDGDGDLDSFVGASFKDTQFYRNTGTPSNPVFSDRSTNPFGLTGSVYDNYTYVDIDSDGDLDAFFIDFYNKMQFYRNTGSGTNPVFSDSSTSPFGLSTVAYQTDLSFVDIDSDGDLDAFAGTLYDMKFFRNTGSDTNPVFSGPIANPFGLFYVGREANPTFHLTFGDIDGDGDLDAFVGHVSGDTLFFTNSASVDPYVPEPEDPDGKTADEIFKSELSANEKLVIGAEEAGMIRVMADFSKAAYHLEKHENNIINDFNDFADAARDEVIAQGWQPLNFNFELKSGSFFYTNHDLDSKSEVIQTNGMNNGFYTNGNAAAFVARSDDAIVLSFRGTNDNGDENPTDLGNNFYPDKEDWDDAGHHYYELLLPLIHEFDKYVSENGISKVYVTGHSLGGAMAINYMRTHPDDSKYQAITFAAPAFVSRTGITVTESDFHPDSRTTQIEISKDPVPMTWDVLSILSDTNRPGDVIRFAGDKTLDGLFSTDNHSMDYYRQITDSVDASIWMKILAEAKTEDQNVFIGGRQNGDNFIVDGRESGKNIILDDGNDKLFGPDTGEYDFFYGGRGLDKLTGGADKEFFYGASGNDIIDGDFGIDSAIYSASRSNYTLQLNESLFSADQRIVTDQRTGIDNDGVDTLENVERLIFTDSGIAFDLNDSGGNAGKVAKLIGAVFGAGSVSKADYVAIGLYYLDTGTSYEDLAAGAISIAGAKSPEEVVSLLWNNVVGSLPTADQIQSVLDDLGTSIGELGVYAAEYSLNQTNINLVGLAENGIVFDPLHYQPIG